MNREDKQIVMSVTTFQKTPALDRFIETYIEQGYDKACILHIADDWGGKPYEIKYSENPHNPVWEVGVEKLKVISSEFVKETAEAGLVMQMKSALDIYNKYKDKIDVAISFGQGRGGVAVNKNRGIDFFQKHTTAKYLFQLDDDQYFAKSGLCEHLIDISARNNMDHLTGVWAEAAIDVKPGLSGRTWYEDFPVKGLSKDGLISWHGGCHGNLNFYTRKCIDRIGYYARFSGKYGFEHSEHTARAMRAVAKRSVMWYPQVNTKKWVQCQSISNNYFDTAEDIAKNNPEYYAKLEEIAQGLNLRATDPLFDPKTETTLMQSNSPTI